MGYFGASDKAVPLGTKLRAQGTPRVPRRQTLAGKKWQLYVFGFLSWLVVFVPAGYPGKKRPVPFKEGPPSGQSGPGRGGRPCTSGACQNVRACTRTVLIWQTLPATERQKRQNIGSRRSRTDRKALMPAGKKGFPGRTGSCSLFPAAMKGDHGKNFHGRQGLAAIPPFPQAPSARPGCLPRGLSGQSRKKALTSSPCCLCPSCRPIPRPGHMSPPFPQPEKIFRAVITG